MSDKIRDRISKLLNMTVKNGCSEDEQESAMRIAAGLAAKAGIDLELCRPKDAPKPKAIHRAKYQELKPHQALAAEAAAQLYGVECNVYNLGAHGISFVGREENIEAAEETWFWLMRQVEELYKQALPRGLSKSDRAEFRKTFKAGCAMRVKERAIKLMREMVLNDEKAQQSTGHNALVVQGHFKQLYGEIDSYWEEIYFKPAREREERQRVIEERLKESDPSAYERLMKERAKDAEKAASHTGRRGRSIPVGSGTNAGIAAGDRVKLRREVS